MVTIHSVHTFLTDTYATAPLLGGQKLRAVIVAVVCSDGLAAGSDGLATQIELDLLRGVNDLVENPISYGSAWLSPPNNADDASEVRDVLNRSLTASLGTRVFGPTTMGWAMPGNSVPISVANDSTHQTALLSMTFLDVPIKGQFIAAIAAIGSPRAVE